MEHNGQGFTLGSRPHNHHPVANATHIGAKPGKKPILGHLETKLVDYAVDRSMKGIGFGKKQFF